MKKTYSIIFMFIVIFSFSVVFAEDINIVISPQKVMVNGSQRDFEVYNIDGNNFFKLRDIAFVLNKTTSQFSVNYSDEKKLIELQKGNEYKALGSEMKIGEDKSKTAVKSSQSLSINGETQNLTAYNIDGNNFFKLRELGEKLDFLVDYDQKSNSVLVDSKKEETITNITDVVAKIFEGTMYIEITCDSPIIKFEDALWNTEDSSKVVLDILNSKFTLKDKEILVNYGGLSKLRFGDQGENKNRIVLDLEEESEYKILQSSDKKVLYLALSKDFELANLNREPDKVLLVYNGSIISIPGSNENVSDDKNLPENEKTPQEDANKDETNGDVIEPESNKKDEEVESGDNIKEEENTDIEKNENEDIKEPTEEDLKNRIKITSIKYSSSTNKVKIMAADDFEYEVDTQNNPYRVIIDIQNAVLNVDGPTSIKPNNKNITEIRFSQKEQMVVRVVFELKAEMEHIITEKDSLIEVKFEEPKYKNVSYNVFDDYAEVILYNVKKNVFSVTESSRYNKYTLKFSESKFKAGNEFLEMDDNFVENIEIKSGKIIIDGQDETVFKMKQDGDNVVIKIQNIEEVEEEEEFVILLDAGHGGKDPGACHNGSYDPLEQEKTYTLKIMLKLKELLEETEGIKVITSRTTDVYIDRQGRHNFLLENIDEANMMVSVHINSHSVKAYKGTMVLFYNKPNEKEDYGITSKELALLVKDNLVNDLGLQDRGVVSRNDQWILEQNNEGKISAYAGEERPVTNLPTILCELCFISNDEEFEKLTTEEFQDTAANAIYNGIIAAKEQMQK